MPLGGVGHWECAKDAEGTVPLGGAGVTWGVDKRSEKKILAESGIASISLSCECLYVGAFLLS